MWRFVSNSEHDILQKAAANLMIDTQRFLEAMRRITKEWPFACEHNLTAQGINHLAFLGHCACCLEVKSPEDITRQAWHTLTKDQQDWANLAAYQAYLEWLEFHQKYEGNQQCLNINWE